MKRSVFAALAIALAAAAVGAGYQTLGTWRDTRRFPQQGHSILLGPEFGNTTLNLDCSGQGSPTVILDSGMGVPAVGWTNVQTETAKFARVCSYDRAGYGWSHAGPEPRSSLQIAKELEALLNAAGENGPYVLVGHSFGGFNVRVFTQLYPKEVSGVVLAEGAHEDEDAQVNALLPAAVVERENTNDQFNARMDLFLRPFRIDFGINRLEVATGWGILPYGVVQASRVFPREFQQELLYLRQQDKFQNAVDSESKAFEQSIAQVRAAGNLGDRPLIVLTAGKPYPPDPLLTKEQMDKQSDLWINVLQAQLTHLSTRGKQIIVPNSSHMIPFDRPDVVIGAIREVCDAVRSK